MKLKKYMNLLLYGLLILICGLIVWLMGMLSAPPVNHPEATESQSGWEGETEAAGPAGETESQTQAGEETGEEAKPEDWEAWSEKNRSPQSREKAGEKEEEGAEESYVPPTVMFASDLHYMSSTTHDLGKAFWSMEENDDGKLNQYSEEVTDALLDQAMQLRPSVLVLAGDITHNGERENHQRLADKLEALQEAGVRVAVIPGNHDIQNTNASTYFGDKREQAEYLHTGEEFYEIYHSFGFDQSPNRDPASLSYVYPVDESHWLLMLDSCQYEDRNHVNGRIKPETLAWLRVHLQVAKEHNIQVLPVAHHNLLSESRMYTSDCTIENHKELLELLEEYKVPLFISGHLHAQRIKKHKSEPGVEEGEYGITEIVLSPYSIPANQYGTLYWDQQNGVMEFRTGQVDVAAYARAQGSTDENLLQFSSFSSSYMKQVIQKQAEKTISLVPDDLKAEMGALYGELYYDYCNGNAMSWDQVRATAAYRLWQRVYPDGVYTARIGQMIQDVRQDLHQWSYTGGPMEGEPWF